MAFTQVDSWSGVVATVVAPVVVSVGKITLVRGWVTGLSDWVAIPLVNVTLGVQFAATVRWENRGSTAAKGRVAATMVKPSGQRIFMPFTINQDVVALAGQYAETGSTSVVLDEVGSYSLEVTLSLEPA